MTIKTEHKATRGQVRTALTALRRHYEDVQKRMGRQSPTVKEPILTRVERAALSRIQKHRDRIKDERRFFRPTLDVDETRGAVSYKYRDTQRAKDVFYQEQRERRTTVNQIYNDLRLELESAGVYDLSESVVRGKLEQAMRDITTLQTMGEQPVMVVPGDTDEEED